MTRASDACAMAVLVEAAHDGRLGAGDEASLARHMDGCASCRALAAKLDGLDALAKGAPRLVATPLEKRRGRLALLRAAALMPEATRATPKHRALAMAMGATIAVGAGGAVALAKTGSNAVVSRARPIAEPPAVVATNPAGVRGHAKDGVLEIEDGAVAVRASHPVLVRAGDLVVQGQGAFVVDAGVSGVASIAVASGSARVHVRGSEPVDVAAGESVRIALKTSREPEVVASLPASPEAPTASLANPPPRLPARAPAHAEPIAIVEPPAPSATVSAPPSAPEPPHSGALAAAPPDTNFADAVKLVGERDYAGARAKLEAFRAAHPVDARAEDAAFLEVVALERAGKHAEARVAARKYLTLYPNGFRRAEAESVAASAR